MKSVLISIQPKWCELIASGEKTVEVRKTRPKIDTPFKCYIYRTKGFLRHLCNGLWWNMPVGGEVIGEFVCAGIDDIECCSDDHNYFSKNGTCLSVAEIIRYCNGKDLYGWHISDLVIYDQPKELSEFYTVCKMNCEYCEMWGSVRVNAEEFDMDCKSDWFNHKPLKRPPQSWCYVEEVSE